MNNLQLHFNEDTSLSFFDKVTYVFMQQSLIHVIIVVIACILILITLFVLTHFKMRYLKLFYVIVFSVFLFEFIIILNSITSVTDLHKGHFEDDITVTSIESTDDKSYGNLPYVMHYLNSEGDSEKIEMDSDTAILFKENHVYTFKNDTKVYDTKESSELLSVAALTTDDVKRVSKGYVDLNLTDKDASFSLQEKNPDNR